MLKIISLFLCFFVIGCGKKDAPDFPDAQDLSQTYPASEPTK